MPQAPCSCCYDKEFDEKTAVAHVRDYRKAGPPRATRFLADELAPGTADGLTILDIGGGVGALHHLLLERGATAARGVAQAVALSGAALTGSLDPYGPRVGADVGEPRTAPSRWVSGNALPEDGPSWIARTRSR